MIISEVVYEQFKESMRLDTEYYLPEYIEVEDSLKSLNVKTVSLEELRRLYKNEKNVRVQRQVFTGPGR
jgi:hypothetical protein